MEQKYKKMIQRMKEKDGRTKMKRREKWFLYVLRCRDGTFYTGIAKDLAARLKKHNDGKGARYTRTRRPAVLVYQETCKSRSEALVRECAVKAISRKRKEALVLSKGVRRARPRRRQKIVIDKACPLRHYRTRNA